MNTRHPTIDEIADHTAGLTSASVADEIAQHLATCPECRDIVARLTDVEDLLAATGAEPLTMPADVVSRLDDALAMAAVEDAAGVPSLTDRRVTKTSEDETAEPPTDPDRVPAGRAGRRSRWVLGAAAAVAVFALGGAVLSNGLPGSSPSSSESNVDSAGAGSAADSGAGSDKTRDQPQPESTFNSGSGPATLHQGKAPKLNKDSVASYAQELAGAHPAQLPTAASTRAANRCGYPRTAAQGDGNTRPVDAYVVFDGNPALLRVQRSPRQLTVFSCPGPERVLYSSTY